MKKLFLIITIALVTSHTQAQQVNLYDSTTQYAAYIDFDKESIIFLWDGTRVAYLEQMDNETCIFGFNREFLGWYENGNIYDREGYKIGSRHAPRNMRLKMEPMKKIQRISPMKPITPITHPRKPMRWKPGWSDMGLEDFLSAGKK